MINLLQIISEIRTIKSIIAGRSSITYGRAENYEILSENAVIWIFLAQSFPLRLSAPLQILLDCDQKRDFNGREEKRDSKETSKEFNT